MLQDIDCTPGPEAIDDGVIGQRPFTRTHFVAFRAFVAQLAALHGNPQAMGVLRALQIRSDDVIFPRIGIEQAIDSPEDAMQIIRRLAPLVRASLHEIEDDAPITTDSLTGLADADVIDEQQPDGRAALVGAIRLMHTLTQQIMAAGNGDETLARAVDAACENPLQVAM